MCCCGKFFIINGDNDDCLLNWNYLLLCVFVLCVGVSNDEVLVVEFLLDEFYV